MKVLNIVLNEQLLIDEDLAACIGYFDGFHYGHQGLFNQTLKAAKERNLKSALITFDPDPWVIIKGIDNITHLSSMEDRIKWAEDLGFDYFLILNFTREMSSLEPSKFVEEVLLKNRIKYLVCGFDFHFGAFGKGDAAFLKTYNKDVLRVKEIEEIVYEGSKISTTRITECIDKGDIEKANILLTRPYTLNGVVVKGNQKGRTIGFPTANIKLTNNYVMPQNGVYIGKVMIDNEEYQAMINIGHNPTFNLVDHTSIEAHIIDFNGDIYNKNIKVMLYKFIREEKKFDTVNDLIDELKKNVEQTKEYFEV